MHIATIVREFRLGVGLLAATALVLALASRPALAQFGASISAPAALNSNAFTDNQVDAAPDLATDGAGHWVAVWHSDDSLGGTLGSDRDILVSRSSDNGASWSPAAPLHAAFRTDANLDFIPQIATDRAGVWLVVWFTINAAGGPLGDDRDLLFSRSLDNGLSWSAPAPLNTNAATDAGWDFAPSIAVDAAGRWLVAWQSEDTLGGTLGTDDDILFARSSDRGATWSAPAPLNTTAVSDLVFDDDEAPQVASDRQGGWLAAWHSSRNVGGTIGTDRDILVARSSDFGQTWSAPAVLNANAASDTGHDTTVQIATDGAGRWVAAWVSDDTLNNTINRDWDILTARSEDNGLTWSPPFALNSGARTDQLSHMDYGPHLVTDRAGNWIAIWHSNTNLGGLGNDADILISRSTDNGATWTAQAPYNTNATSDGGEDRDPRLATDGRGNWAAAWWSTNTLGNTIGGDQDILTARFQWGGCPGEQDCNSNGVCDSSDVGAGTSADCDGNALPDECQPDADHDGRIDPCDGCVDDPAKIAPGLCGCGEIDRDCDSSGVCDGAEIAVGTSPDCDQDGVPDGCQPDRDHDGAIDACDECPDDPTRTAAGLCGCGVPEADCNSNGVCDVVDIQEGRDCNENAVPDDCESDIDSDGAIDVCDDCPNDSAKTGPGLCGCGEAEIDCDSNGLCDATEISAGPVDCNSNGVLDACEPDADGDGRIDECDGCQNDPAKTSAGLCGCGAPDVDCDSNGVCDSVQVGQGAADCDGNGVPDACDPDADTDGTIDGCDGCPEDPAKSAAGICGCGAVDADCDLDGLCDAAQIAAGSSMDCDGSGVPDVCEADSDSDGVIDNCDECPDDPDKTSGGACGCGVVDADCNSNGICDPAEVDSGESADCDGNGVPDGCQPLTVEGLVAALVDPANPAAAPPCLADVNEDGLVNGADVAAFVQSLASP